MQPQPLQPLQLDQEQAEAHNACVDTTNRIVAVTGQAGTGKTTIMRQVYEALTANGYRVALCAPTGKAAKRIQEATGIEAMTIHRLLEYPFPGERDPKTGRALSPKDPKRDKWNPLDYDIVMADEYAMVNNEVDRNLLNALPRAGCIRLFGDVNQLRPIESNKILASQPSPFQRHLEKFSSIRLTTIHRQSEGSGIVENGDLILKGRCPRRLDDFTIKITDSPVDAIRQYVIDARDNSDADYATLDYQIITPGKKSWVGTAKLNAALQILLNESYLKKDSIHLPRHTWAPDQNLRVAKNDKVIWTENDYNLEIMNGETGIVLEVDEDNQTVVLDLGDREAVIPPEMIYIDRTGREKRYHPQRSIELAYAITTHKAQGSEYKHVMYVLNKSVMYNLCRSNIYTGVTRARAHVHLVSDMRSMQLAVTRVTTLAEEKYARSRPQAR